MSEPPTGLSQGPTDDELHARFRDLLIRIWEDGTYRRGPSLAEVVDWHCQLWDGHPQAGLIRDNPRRRRAAATRLGKQATRAFRRCRRRLETSRDHRGELHLIARPVAELVVRLNTARLFEIGNRQIEALVVHCCCKLADVAAPELIGDSTWLAAIKRYRDEALPPDVRRAALINLLIKRIREATAERRI